MIAYITTMFYSLVLFIPILTEGTSITPTHLLVTRVGPCYESVLASDVVTVSEMSLSRGLYESSLTGWINISVDIPNGWTIKAIVQKCHDIRNLDTCDSLKQFHIITNGCADSEQEELYSMFFHYVKPKLECPIKAGKYKITDYPFFTEDSDLTASESKISTSVFGYTYRLQGYDDDDDDDSKRLLCTDASLQLLYIREHDWKGLKNSHINSTTNSLSHLDRPIGNQDPQNTNQGSEDKQVEVDEYVADGDKVQDNDINASAEEEQNEE